MVKLGFDTDEQAFFEGCSNKYADNEMYKDLINKYIEDAERNLEYVDTGLITLAEKYGDHIYSLRAIFLLEACEILMPKFLAQGNSEEFFYSTMRDIRIKANECKRCYGILGVYSKLSWFADFYNLSRLWLGRFQFEGSEFGFDRYEKDGVIVNKHDKVINFHIPSDGPMLEEDCFKAYDLACEHFKELYDKNGYLVIMCGSWLLYEKHYEFLNPNSNIVKFMNQFDIISTTEEDSFSNGWRIFGSGNSEDASKLPVNTSLQKAYKKWFCDGNKAGYSYGIRIHKIGDR